MNNSSGSRGPKSIPSQVQLPGGIMLKGIPFKIVAYNADGTPKLFEIQSIHDPRVEGACVLFAQEEWIRSAVPGKRA